MNDDALRERLRMFFVHVAHGDSKHRKWLHGEFQRFWDIKLDDVGEALCGQYEDKIWRPGCNYQVSVDNRFCNKCGYFHDQTYKEAHGEGGPLRGT